LLALIHTPTSRSSIRQALLGSHIILQFHGFSTKVPLSEFLEALNGESVESLQVILRFTAGKICRIVRLQVILNGDFHIAVPLLYACLLRIWAR
jgi:hypothetical protein